MRKILQRRTERCLQHSDIVGFLLDKPDLARNSEASVLHVNWNACVGCGMYQHLLIGLDTPPLLHQLAIAEDRLSNSVADGDSLLQANLFASYITQKDLYLALSQSGNDISLGILQTSRSIIWVCLNPC